MSSEITRKSDDIQPYKLKILDIKNLDSMYVENKEIFESNIYPKINKIIYTYLEEVNIKPTTTNSSTFRVEIPKDVIPNLLNGTAEFMKDSEGKTLPCIRNAKSKRIIRQIRLELITKREEESSDYSQKNFNKLNNIAMQKMMEKIYEDLEEVKELVQENNDILKDNIYSDIESGRSQYLQAQYDNEEVKREVLINARQTLIIGITKLKKRIESNKKYFNEAKKKNYIIRELFTKKYNAQNLKIKSLELDKNIEYLYMGIYYYMKINLDLGSSKVQLSEIFGNIEQEIIDIEVSDLESLMPESEKRQNLYYNIRNIRESTLLEINDNEKLIIDVEALKEV